jgi:hypothetical protein
MKVVFGRMVSHYMVEMIVWLVWQKEKPASASFDEFLFWTETSDGFLVD